MTQRDQIILELARKYDNLQVQIFLEIIDGVRQCKADRRKADDDYMKQLNAIDGETRRLQSRCSHPLKYSDSGGQYQSVSTYCRCCGAEL